MERCTTTTWSRGRSDDVHHAEGERPARRVNGGAATIRTAPTGNSPSPAVSRPRVLAPSRSAERHEDRDARLGSDLARPVTLAGEILGDEDVAGREPLHRAVADLDVDGAG